MFQPNGINLNRSGRPTTPPAPAGPKPATPAQRKAVQVWNRANLPERHLADLHRALGILQLHPDAHAPGYSPAKNARERVAAEIARRTC